MAVQKKTTGVAVWLVERGTMLDMGTPVDWDFALELSGVTPDSLPMSALASYLTLWADLLGVEHRPVFKGIIKGCVVLRAKVGAVDRASTFSRLHNAANDQKVRPHLDSIEKLLSRDGIRSAKVSTREGQTLQLVRPAPAIERAEMTVTDSAQVDGRVFRISGKDETTSVGLIEDGTGRAISVETRSDDLARRFAQQFKGKLLRVQVNGTWTRNADGVWEPKNLRATEFEVLEDTPLVETMRSLRQALGNGWADMTASEALATWREIRFGPQEQEDVNA